MFRHLLLLCLGMCFWSCNDCPPQEEIISKIKGVSIQHFRPETPSGDSYHQQYFSIGIIDSVIEIRTVILFPKNQFDHYATVGPFGCELDAPITTYVNNFEILEMLSDKPYNTHTGHDLSNILIEKVVGKKLPDLAPFYSGGVFESVLQLTEAPSKLDTFQLILRARDINGMVFTDTLNKVVIGP